MYIEDWIQDQFRGSTTSTSVPSSGLSVRSCFLKVVHSLPSFLSFSLCRITLHTVTENKKVTVSSLCSWGCNLIYLNLFQLFITRTFKYSRRRKKSRIIELRILSSIIVTSPSLLLLPHCLCTLCSSSKTIIRLGIVSKDGRIVERRVLMEKDLKVRNYDPKIWTKKNGSRLDSFLFMEMSFDEFFHFFLSYSFYSPNYTLFWWWLNNWTSSKKFKVYIDGNMCADDVLHLSRKSIHWHSEFFTMESFTTKERWREFLVQN